MRKGTVRDMKKKVLQRGLFGIPTGIAIGYVITVMMSAFWGDGSYYPCVPAFVDAMGSEIRAVVVQTVLCGLVGMVYAAGAVVWEVDRWSLAGQTAAYFLITLGSVLPVAYAAYWMERTISEACEYACDEAVTKAMAPAEKLRYSQMILHVASCRTPALALGFSDSAKQLKRRFLHMNTPRKAGKTILASLLAAVMLVSVFCLSTFVLAWNTTGVEEPNVEVDELIEDKVSVLLVGSDGGGYNTDTLMLVMMDCKTHTINILSIPRDTRVPNPYGGSGYAKINSVYAANGMDGLIRQVGEVTGLPVNFYVKVDFAGFREAIDALGGVDFDVPMRLKYDDPAQDLHIDLQPGMQHLNGAQAEMLVRSRNQYPMADITRTEVQRDFLKAVITQHATAANLLKINDLYSILTQYVTTNITLGDALKYGPQITKVSSESIQSYILPGTTDSYGNWLYDAEEMERLANEVFWYNVTVRPTPRPTKTPSRIDVYTY